MSAVRWGCYVHVPWCRAQCPYCGFYVVAGPEAPPWRAFVDRILAERAAQGAIFGSRPTTVYLGGGTPSRLPPEALGAVIGGLDPVPGAEISAEANPEDVDDAWLEGAGAGGVSRVSLGVQSFVPHVAGRLGRAHTTRQAEAACRRLQGSAMQSWSLDLIFAVPGQSLADLDADLDRIEALGPPHVSIYGLTIEPGTAFERASVRGRLPAVDEDTWRAMYDRIVARLGDAGLHRYEVSNFARDGHRCAHNALYWSDLPYLGLGPGAHSYAPDGRRWVNAPDLAGYLAGRVDRDAEEPDAEQRATDLLVSGLRGVEGVDRERLRTRTGLDVDDRIVGVLVRQGLLAARPGRLALTTRGFPMADGVARRLLDTLLQAAEGGSGGPVRSG